MTAPITTGSDAKDASAAAKQLEAYFLRRILSEVGPGGAFGGDGGAGSTFRGLFEEALADAVSETGQVGLAETIAGSLTGAGGRRASADLASTAVWADASVASDGDTFADPEALADEALAAKTRQAIAGPEGGEQVAAGDTTRAASLNPGRKGTNPTQGGE
ncbi:MAG: hypothetical protein AAF721_08075 [Myxococcota bacterium]